MNTGPADTRFPHLDLGDLIAEVNGQPIADPAREHLMRCEHCRAEANRWDLVAAGVRGLADATPETVRPARPGHTRLGHTRPGHTRPRVLTGPWRRAMLVAGSAAAALVLLVAVGEATGRVQLSFGSGSGSGSGSSTGSGTVLTAVSGCAQIEQAEGTLEQVNGTSLVIKTASGQPVTVTTTASTRVSLAGALRSDITDGAPVIVLGPSSDGTIAATSVILASPSNGTLTPPSGWVVVRGTVSDASTDGFTVVTSGGARIPVTTSSGTLVAVTSASLGQLQAGVITVAVGRAGPDGTLSAGGVVQSQPVSQSSGGPTLNIHFNETARGRGGCSPASLADALATELAYRG
jgi:hypothetical protein